VNIPANVTPLLVTVNTDSTTNPYTFSGAGKITGSTAINKTGTGILNITNSGGNDYTGGTKISAGTLAFSASALPATGSIIMDGGALQWLSNSDDVSGRLSFVSGKTATLDDGGNAVTLASAWSFDSSVTLAKAGSGTITLSNSASTFIGNVEVNNGTLEVNASRNSVRPAAGALGNSQIAHNVTVNNGGTLKFLLGDTFGGSSTTVQTNLVINAGGTVTNNGNNFTTLGNVYMNGGTLTNTNGANTLYQGYFLRSSVIVGGTTPSTISYTGTPADPLNPTGGVHLYFQGQGTTFNVADATGNADADLNVSAVLINGTDPGAGAAGNLSAYPGALTKTGAGTMVVTVDAAYTGNTTVNAGVLDMLNINTPAATVTASGGELVAQSITTGTLRIGAGAKVTIKPLPGSGPMSGMTSLKAVPEPSTWAMLMLAVMGLGIYWRRSR
jgi:fibronectin-binding autotransporter adhesin